MLEDNERSSKEGRKVSLTARRKTSCDEVMQRNSRQV
jgi:hypothetical protein